MTDVIEIFVNGEQYTDVGGVWQFENIQIGDIIDDIVFYHKREVGDVIEIRVVG